MAKRIGSYYEILRKILVLMDGIREEVDDQVVSNRKGEQFEVYPI